MFMTSQIKEHMAVVGSDGKRVGTVDHIDDDDQIKLTRGDSADGEHHFVPLDWVDRVDDVIHLNKASVDVASMI